MTRALSVWSGLGWSGGCGRCRLQRQHGVPDEQTLEIIRTAGHHPEGTDRSTRGSPWPGRSMWF
jgi:hypothetical protein